MAEWLDIGKFITHIGREIKGEANKKKGNRDR
jgi:hypothetical protein